MTDWSSLRVVDLKAELTNRGLPTKGVKADLVQRLTEDDVNAAQVEKPAVEDEPAVNEAVSTVEDAPGHDSPERRGITKESISTNAPANENGSLRSEATPNPDAPAEPATSQEVASAENPIAQPENSEQPDLDTPLPPTDTVVDLQKRKRRSSTPPPSSKRARQEGERLAEDREDVVDFDNGDIAISPNKSQNGLKKLEASSEDVEMVIEDQFKEGPKDDKLVEATGAGQETLDSNGLDAYAKGVIDPESFNAPVAQPKHEQFSSTGDADTPQHLSPTKQDPHGESKDDIPSLEEVKLDEEVLSLPSSLPPTSALYIRELMRPLRSEVMEQYIIELLTPSGKESDPNLIQDFYLDQIRTHAFVLLPSVSAAQRVRAAIHNQVWPNERNRKPLWVDFIPAGSVKDWISREESAPRGARWEVVYEQDGGSAVAVHREVGSDSKPFSRPPPTGPAATAATAGPVYPGIEAAPRGPRGAGVRQPFQNPHIRQTETFPQLTYTPKDEDVARRRMGNMRSFYSRDPPADLGKDYHRYTFESADAFVDRGREVFIGIRPPHRQKEHEERLRRERLGTAGARSTADSRRDDYRPAPRPSVTDEDRFSRYNDGRRSEWPPRNRGFRGDRGPGRFRGDDPYRYRPGY